MTKEQKDFFNVVIKPRLIEMAIDNTLPMDMNELHYHAFEERATNYNEQSQSNATTMTKGELFVAQIRPFIGQKCSSPNEVVKAIAKDLDRLLDEYQEIIDRSKQLLSALDYGELTDYQGKVVLLLEQKLKKIEA